MTKCHLLEQLVQIKEREFEPLIIYLEGYVTFSFVGNENPISSPNSHTGNNSILYLRCRLL